jgi:hypothetical protein
MISKFLLCFSLLSIVALAQDAKTYDNGDGTHTTFRELCGIGGTCHLTSVTTKDAQGTCSIGDASFLDDSFECGYISAITQDSSITGQQYCEKNHGGGFMNKKRLEKQCKQSAEKIDNLISKADAKGK